METPGGQKSEPSFREGLPSWVKAQCRPYFFRKQLLVCAQSEHVSDSQWETIRKSEVKLGTPLGHELRDLAKSLQIAVNGWDFDWKLTAKQKALKGRQILSLVNQLQRELRALEGDGISGAGQWIGVMQYHDIRLYEQLESLKDTISKWQALPAPAKRPAGTNAARNFFIWYLADSFKRRYGRLLLDVVHACACAHFDSALELERSAVSKIARGARTG